MKREKNWWKKAVIYQIYPRSFQDSNGDGIGDIPGIISRLDYLQTLGVDAVWLSPVYRSPQDDNGYDISDYQDIDSSFGTLEDMEELIEEADRRGIGIIMDLVLNHSSDEHRWFQEAKKGKDNPFHDYYVWRDGTADTPPNELRSCFGGSAWEWVPQLGQYYLHQFSVKQPDLNWENPRLRQELYDMINWWIDKGVAGFRLDVIDLIGKLPDQCITVKGPRLHDYVKELSANTFRRGGALVTVGEAWSADIAEACQYSNPDGTELSMVFQFEHICLDQQAGGEKWDLAPLSLVQLKRVFEKWQTQLAGRGWNSLFWDNHDLPRIVSRWGNDGPFRQQSAKMLATLLHGMQGTPYIYQGEELAMTNIRLGIEDYQDIETRGMYEERLAKGYRREEIMESIYAKGRDNARTPMQWTKEAHAGFTTGTPWLPVNPNHIWINAEDQVGREASVFEYYRELIRLRKEHGVFADGDFDMKYREHPHLVWYERRNDSEEMLVVCNFHEWEQTLPLHESWEKEIPVLSNYAWQEWETLRPYEARMYIREKRI